jgi:hypothetical protein
MIMAKLIVPTYCLLLCVSIAYYSSCNNKTVNYCELNTKLDSIKLTYPDTFIVYYKLNEKFIDISDSIWFRHWGADEMKMYINGKDTLGIEWYWNIKPYEDELAKKWIEGSYSSLHGLDCPQTVTNTYCGQLRGVFSEIVCPDPTRMVFFGINKASNYLVVAYFHTNASNKCAKEEFLEILNSMVFEL